MRTIYIDTEYKCHTTNNGTMMAIETDFFDNKCNAFIEGYRYVPFGHYWNGFKGQMLAPYKDYNILKAYQQQYEEMLAEQEEMKQALEILGVKV